MNTAESTALAKPRRVNGIVLMLVLVAVGMGATSVLFKLVAGKVNDDRARTMAGMPDSPEGRLERWLEFGRTYFDARLVQLRLSAQRPWLIAQTVAAEKDSAEQEIWGVDIAHLTTAATTREGMKIVLTLPPATLLARGPLAGDKALNVPHYASGGLVPAPEVRVREIVDWALKPLIDALHKDIPGATLEVRIGAAAEERGG